MFFPKALDLVEEVTVAGVTVAVEVIVVAGITAQRRDRLAAAPIRHQDPTEIRHGQVPARAGKVPAAAMGVVPPAHHDRAQHGQAAQYGKDRAQ